MFGSGEHLGIRGLAGPLVSLGLPFLVGFWT
jgi:hypothetical protein